MTKDDDDSRKSSNDDGMVGNEMKQPEIVEDRKPAATVAVGDSSTTVEEEFSNRQHAAADVYEDTNHSQKRLSPSPPPSTLPSQLPSSSPTQEAAVQQQEQLAHATTKDGSSGSAVQPHTTISSTTTTTTTTTRTTVDSQEEHTATIKGECQSISSAATACDLPKSEGDLVNAGSICDSRWTPLPLPDGPQQEKPKDESIVISRPTTTTAPTTSSRATTIANEISAKVLDERQGTTRAASATPIRRLDPPAVKQGNRPRQLFHEEQSRIVPSTAAASSSSSTAVTTTIAHEISAKVGMSDGQQNEANSDTPTHRTLPASQRKQQSCLEEEEEESQQLPPTTITSTCSNRATNITNEISVKVLGGTGQSVERLAPPIRHPPAATNTTTARATNITNEISAKVMGRDGQITTTSIRGTQASLPRQRHVVGYDNDTNGKSQTTEYLPSEESKLVPPLTKATAAAGLARPPPATNGNDISVKTINGTVMPGVDYDSPLRLAPAYPHETIDSGGGDNGRDTTTGSSHRTAQRRPPGGGVRRGYFSEPGAYRIGGRVGDSQVFDTLCDPSNGFAIDEAEDGSASIITPLDADVVPDYSEILQRRIAERTIDALAVSHVNDNVVGDDDDDDNNIIKLETERPAKKRNKDRIGGCGQNAIDGVSLRRKKKQFCCIVMLTIGLVVGIFLVAYFVNRPRKGCDDRNNCRDSSGSSTTTTQDDGISDERTKLFDTAVDLVAPISGGRDIVLDESSPQHKALSWLVHDDGDGARSTQQLQQKLMSSPTILMERYVISVLYFSTGGPNWFTPWNFLSNESVCTWNNIHDKGLSSTAAIMGIKCNGQGLVSSIHLDYNGLNGTIPSELHVLSSLEEISMDGGTYLHGTLPSIFGTSLSRTLEVLHFGWNHLTGGIPESYSNLRRLKRIRLTDNKLSGSIPNNLFRITSLEFVDMQYNHLTGPIPASGAEDGSLAELWLVGNMISGSIPESIYTPRLEVLSVWENQLTGTLSTKLNVMVEAWYFDVGLNRMTGTLPTEFGSLVDLEQLYLSSNSFSGTIPTELGLLSRMEWMWLHENNLSGSVPMEVSQQPSGQSSFHFNNLTGSLDPFCNLPNYQTQLTADCLAAGSDDNGTSPKMDCPCCTLCCNTSTEECKPNFDAMCALEKRWTENENGFYYVENSGAICDCMGEGVNVTLSCRDTGCQTCNRDGTVCSINEGYQYRYAENGLDYAEHRSEYQYKVGLNDTVTFKWWLQSDYSTRCEVDINGNACNTCGIQTCSNGFQGYSINCENVPGAGSIDLCNEAAEDDGPLTVFALQDATLLQGCPPRFPSLHDDL